ncbi:MAG: hypothetical protein RJB66_1185 [Pseudomonadota bacterium]|jgi:hypothetical protein
MELLKKIPPSILVFVVIVGASLFIMLNEPPKDVCDAQLEVLMKSQSGRLSSLRGRINSLWARAAKSCQESKSYGGCVEFHEALRLALTDIQSAPYECTDRLVTQEWLRKVLTNSMVLMIKVAWGDKVPESGPAVFGWMTPSELSVFCKIQEYVKRTMTDEEWEAFVRKTLSGLPHVSELKFEEGYWRSLFSVRCDAVL